MRWAMSDFSLSSALRGLVILLALGPGAIASAQTPDAATILASSDKARGGGLPGILWQVNVETSVTKPVPISPRQRLTGQASYGDIAATNYVKDYSAVMLGNEVVDAVPCYVLELTAASKSVTYDKVKYWIAQDSGLGIRAEFYTVSGKHIKTARFKYDNQIGSGDKSIPFVSEMQIVDALAGDAVTTLIYTALEVRTLSARDFRLN